LLGEVEQECAILVETSLHLLFIGKCRLGEGCDEDVSDGLNKEEDT
jgi:hypothetical protein